MTIIECDLHGLQESIRVCEHVFALIRLSGRRLGPIVVFDEVAEPILVCPDCDALFRANFGVHRRSGRDGPGFKTRGVCWIEVEEWLLGSPLSESARARGFGNGVALLVAETRLKWRLPSIGESMADLESWLAVLRTPN